MNCKRREVDYTPNEYGELIEVERYVYDDKPLCRIIKFIQNLQEEYLPFLPDDFDTIHFFNIFLGMVGLVSFFFSPQIMTAFLSNDFFVWILAYSVSLSVFILSFYLMLKSGLLFYSIYLLLFQIVAFFKENLGTALFKLIKYKIGATDVVSLLLVVALYYLIGGLLYLFFHSEKIRGFFGFLFFTGIVFLYLELFFENTFLKMATSFIFPIPISAFITSKLLFPLIRKIVEVD